MHAMPHAVKPTALPENPVLTEKPGENTPEQIATPSTRRLKTAGVIAVVAVAAVLVTGFVSRANGNARVKAWTDAQAVPAVAVTLPGGDGTAAVLTLPGRLEAYARAPIYARVSGYLRNWKADIGTPVKAGQVLAEIEAPDADQQLLQARADLASAEANAALAETTAKRWQSILQSGAVSRQDVDEKNSDLRAREAQVKAAQANVERLQVLAGFERIVAPFDGVVTARNTDVGALINAGSGTGPQLFEISDIRRLRVYVDVPQSYMNGIEPGAKARVSVPEHAGQTFSATVKSSARAVNAASGTTLIQMEVDNPGRQLLPGALASVEIDLPGNEKVLQIPSSALIFDSQGLRAATVDSNSQVRFKTVTIARDLGKTLAIGSGLAADDRVIVSPPDGIAEGDKVRVVETAAEKGK